MSLSPGFYSSDVDTVETAKTLKKALELGATFLSTADFYCGFQPTDKIHSNLSVIGISSASVGLKYLHTYAFEAFKLVPQCLERSSSSSAALQAGHDAIILDVYVHGSSLRAHQSPCCRGCCEGITAVQASHWNEVGSMDNTWQRLSACTSWTRGMQVICLLPTPNFSPTASIICLRLFKKTLKGIAGKVRHTMAANLAASKRLAP